MDESNGWLIGDQWVFHTQDGGSRWSPVTDAQFPDSALKTVHFFDADHGLIFDASDTQWFYATNDGGKTWSYYDPFHFTNNYKQSAFSRVGTGVYLGQNGTQTLAGAASGPDLRGIAQASGLESIRLILVRKDRLLRNADIKDDMKLMVRVKGRSDWQTITLPSAAALETTRGLEISWRPSDQYFRVEPGQIISQKIELKDPDGLTTVVPFSDLEYQPFVQRYRSQLFWALLTSVILLGSAGSICAAYLLRPRILFRVVAKQDEICEALKSAHLEIVAQAVRALFVPLLINKLCLRESAQRSWAAAYLAGDETIEDLPRSLRSEMLKTDLFLDVWVRKRLGSVRKYLSSQLEAIGCLNYIPLPITIRSGGSKSDIPSPSVEALRDVCNENKLGIAIVAGGGRGKTTLAGKLGRWLMEERAEQRLRPARPVLCVLILGETSNVIASVRSALQSGYPDEDKEAYDDSLIIAAFRTQRLALIADGLSEISRSSVNCIQEAIKTIPISLFIYSARKQFLDLSPQQIEIAPEEIGRDWVPRFIGEYVLTNGLEKIISANDQLLLAETVIALVDKRRGHKTVPTLFLRILIQTFEKADELQRRDWRNDAPLSLGETAQRFIREVRPSSDQISIDPEALAQAATMLARLSLATDFVVRPFTVASARSALPENGKSEMTLQALEDCTVIQREITAAGGRYRFYLDPIAEYLAAASWVLELGDDLSAWLAHMAAIEKSRQDGRVVYGYLDALADCVRDPKFGAQVPDAISSWSAKNDYTEIQFVRLEPAVR
ncbi:hypothetical protein AC630_37695 [Bradyrhizobium sp. AS23.2]|nr:hypothetical protein AC630_37695 [Bradyrhizobium sp. AS23.2]